MAVSPWLTRLLPQGNFARGVSVLAGSTALAQGLAVAASPILTRLYTPDDFGLLAIFAAMLSVLAVIAGLRYELTIPLPEDDEDAAKLCVLAVMATVVVSILTALAVVVFGDQIAHSLGVPALAQWLWLLPVTLLFTGIYQALYYVAVRKNEYGTIGRTRFSRALVMLAIQFAAFRFGAVGLVFGHAAGWAAGPIDFVRLLRRKHRDMFRTAFDWTGIRAQALRYKSFPLWSSPGALLNTAGAQMPIIGFALLFSPAAAGLYALTQRVLAMPMQLIGQAVADVFFAQAADAHREKRIGKLVESVSAKLLQISIAPAIILIFTGPTLFAVIFGEQWREAGELSSWLVPWFFIVFVAAPLTRMFMVTDRNREMVAWEAAFFAVRLIIFFVAGRYGYDFLTTAIAVSISSAAIWIGYFVRCLKISHASLRAIVAALLPALPWIVLAAGPSALSIAPQSNILTTVAVALGGAIHVASMVRLNRRRNGI